MKLPIISRHKPQVVEAEIHRARKLAHQIVTETPSLDWRQSRFRELVIDDHISDAPALHIDDFSEVPVIGTIDSSGILQQRSRLRACDGDWIALSSKLESGYSDYCEYTLGLGRVHWLYSTVAESQSRQLALECWQDRRLRHDLEQAIRHQSLKYIHPHVSTFNVWQLAEMLRSSTRMPVSVIGPPPALSNWVNNKIDFSRITGRLLGDEFVPHSESAFNFASLAKMVARLAATNQHIAIKFPYGTGGEGNFVIAAECIRNRNLRQIRNYLKERLVDRRWPRKGRVMIDVWESNVVNSPSVQIWIPPRNDADPIVEGVFVQEFTDQVGQFLGSFQAQLPASLEQQIVDQSFLLAILFQELGYVGRCSFDLILTGESLQDCRVEFIECNGRWGGTSAPMSLMNRLSLCKDNKYGVRRMEIPGLWQVDFAELKRALSDSLYQPSTGQGNIVLFNPGRIKEQSAIEVVAIGPTVTKVKSLLAAEIPRLLKNIVQTHSDDKSISGFLLGHADFDDVETINY